MAKDTLAKQAGLLLTQYISGYQNRYKAAPKLNRYREKWGFQDMVSDLGFDRSQEIVDYYFRTSKDGHPVGFLLNNYDKIDKFYSEKQDDEKRREELRRQTAERVREWEARYDK